jgi:hypothetical protein
MRQTSLVVQASTKKPINLHTFAHLFFAEGAYRVAKNGVPNCIVNYIFWNQDREEYQVLVWTRGLAKLKVELDVHAGNYLCVRNGEMCVALPGEDFILVTVLEDGAAGQAVEVLL